MDKIVVGPEAKKMLMRLFMESYIHNPEPLSGDEIEALCLLTGLQLLGAAHQTPAFKAEILATIRKAAKRTGSPVLGGALEIGPGRGQEGTPGEE